MALFLTPLRADELVIPIQCSPSAVVLHAVRSGDWLTVHADIPYCAVKTDTVWLEAPNGSLKAATTFPDDRGNLVAKFRMRDLTSLLETTEPTNDLTLIGFTEAGIPFVGTDTVRIVKK
jgi:hypothetical protein